MQCDRIEYGLAMRSAVERESNISIRQEMVDDLIIREERCVGIRERSGYEVTGSAVVLATGTFLDGVIHVGDVRYPAGRSGEFPAVNLALALRKLGLKWGRFKTGTPPRIKGSSADLEVMDEDPGDSLIRPFSLRTPPTLNRPRLSCFRTYTTSTTHDIIRRNLLKSPLYSGAITGTPARYCPSLEDKVARFPSRERHPVVVEPEGLHTSELYLKGLGNSLPPEIQIELVHSVPGLDQAEIVRPSYAIEYDYIQPSCLKLTLETRMIAGLYLAGQINGTSGYEEAAAQGLWAGINAALAIVGRQPFVLDRSEAYMGVMVDDLVTRGVKEPYRMFTSRAEYRLLLREDNVADRLLQKGHELGLVPDTVVRRFEERDALLREASRRLETIRIKPEDGVNDMIRSKGGSDLAEAVSAAKLLKRPEISIEDLVSLGLLDPGMDPEIARRIEIDLKYEGYIERQKREAGQFKKMEKVAIPQDVDYDRVPGLSRELRESLKTIRPASLGQVSRIPGITPAALAALMVCLRADDRKIAAKGGS
jgi:tRNA uridine 5-carboxymethylaminomethyl modification enzyme